MSRLGEYIKSSIHENGTASTLIELIARNFTRITVKPKDDFKCTYEISVDSLSIKIEPLSDYGRFIMQKVYDAECKEELDKK